jgi:hypothetical protein
MSLHEWKSGLEISAEGYPFYALIFAALRQADSTNAAKIKAAWPEKMIEAQARYDAPGGILAGD